jgi:hypothetical protein
MTWLPLIKALDKPNPGEENLRKGKIQRNK